MTKINSDIPTFKILMWGDKRLNQNSTDVDVFDESLQTFVLSMLRTIRENDGIGLAAPQVGVLKNIITIWIGDTHPLVIINPKIITMSEDLFTIEEGCLSVPGYFESRSRPNKLVINYRNVDNTDRMLECDGLLSFCIQHEIDHLKGKVFVDKASSLKSVLIKGKIKKHLRNKPQIK